MYVKRRLSDNLFTFNGLRFPFIRYKKSFLKYEVTVGIGGNIGDVKRRFEHLFFEIKKDKRVDLMKSSLILKNPPFGYEKQDDFFNSIIIVKTSMQPHTFLNYLMRLETKFARKRSFANAPRTLDLDIIFFDNRVINTRKLTVPHASWNERDSVLVPLLGLSR